jgi:hypothetical protein
MIETRSKRKGRTIVEAIHSVAEEDAVQRGRIVTSRCVFSGCVSTNRSYRHTGGRRYPNAFEIPGFHVALAASLPGMTIKLYCEF